jgi:hypothetical protein
MQNNHLRYEVIYKNLLRDLRKFFINDFNEATDYIKKKRKTKPSYYIECLRHYVISKNIMDTQPI